MKGTGHEVASGCKFSTLIQKLLLSGNGLVRLRVESDLKKHVCLQFIHINRNVELWFEE